MYKSALNALVALSAVISAFVVWNADTGTADQRRVSSLSATPVAARSTARPKAVRRHVLKRKTARTVRKHQRLRKAKRLRTKTKPFVAIRRKPSFTGVNATPAGKEQEPLGSEWMAGVCNTSGGGASTNPDGTVSCVDPDGEDVLDPVPSPD